MKKATNLFADLFDRSCYIKRSYLEEKLETEMSNELCLLSAASSYAFDYLFAKEKAGEEITIMANEEYRGKTFPIQELPKLAKEILDDIKDGAYFKGKSAFRDYINYLHENDESIENLCKDDLGLLILSVSDRISEALIRGANEDKIMRSCEIVFLNIACVFFDNAKEVFGPAISKRFSYSYLLDLEEKFERSRYENNI